MELELLRIGSGKDDTLGVMFTVANSARQLLCYTLEDEHRKVKVAGETRIPAGRYQVALRAGSPLAKKYARRFPRIHKGMLWLQDVPNFKYVYIHCGNTDDHTDGCILIGNEQRENATGNGYLSQSRLAYRRVYPKLVASAAAGTLFLTVIDHA